ncbi:MAG: acylphosphatase [Vulcanimicrobiaceae bacterium]|jgi:hydrogenase maturation factor HypF (carbamoyltransferase family)
MTASGPRVRAIVRLRGRVQAVGFRDAVIAIAQHHPVAGSVRNLHEGEQLEIDVEGAPDAVDAFLADVLAHPPRYARVESVERDVATPQDAAGFTRGRTT